MDTEIEKQRFDAIQELSQIEMRLSDARVAFENLKKTEEEYLVQREKKVTDRLDSLNENLSEAFDVFLGNKETFEKIKGIISEFSNKAVSITAEIKEIAKTLEERIASADNVVDLKMTKLRDDSKRIIEERKFLDEELEAMYVQRRELQDQMKKLHEAKKSFEEKTLGIE